MKTNLPYPSTIGFAGFKNAGKNEAAYAVKELIPHIDTAVIGCSDAIINEYVAHHKLAGLTDTEKDQQSPHEPQGVTHRDSILKFSRQKKSVNPNYWVEKIAQKIEKVHEQGKVALVHGIRMDAEFDLMLELNAPVIWVNRQGFESDGNDTEQDQQHRCDFSLMNDGGLFRLQSAAQGILQELDIFSEGQDNSQQDTAIKGNLAKMEV